MSLNDSLDTEFYRRHHECGMRLADKATREENTKFIAPGSRYGLAAEVILADAKTPRTLADLGCGDARILFELSRRIQIKSAIGLDVTYRERQQVNGVELFNHNLNSPWPFADRSIDYLMAMMIFEHLFDPFFCFEQVKRCLAENGRAFVNLPLVTGLPNRLRLLFGRVPVTSSPRATWIERREWDGGHLHYFSMDMIDGLVRSCGLEIEAVRGVGRFHSLKTAFPSLLASEVTFSVRHASNEQKC